MTRIVATYYSNLDESKFVNVANNGSRYVLEFHKKANDTYELYECQVVANTLEETNNRAIKWAWGDQADAWKNGRLGDKFER